MHHRLDEFLTFLWGCLSFSQTSGPAVSNKKMVYFCVPSMLHSLLIDMLNMAMLQASCIPYSSIEPSASFAPKMLTVISLRSLTWVFPSIKIWIHCIFSRHVMLLCCKLYSYDSTSIQNHQCFRFSKSPRCIFTTSFMIYECKPGFLPRVNVIYILQRHKFSEDLVVESLVSYKITWLEIISKHVWNPNLWLECFLSFYIFYDWEVN